MDSPRSPRGDGGTGRVGASQAGPTATDLAERLKRLAEKDQNRSLHLGARLRTYFLTGLIIVGPVAVTLYLVWVFVSLADEWIKPLLPASYLPETYLPFAVPGIGLMFGIVGLIIIGALAANLLGRTMITASELMLERMPIVRNLYRALKQVFEGVVTATGQTKSFQRVGLMQFPSEGIWSLVFVTNEAAERMNQVAPGGQRDLVAVFMPTGVVPPTGFICFVPRERVMLLDMTAEDAAKVIISGGMVIPPHPEHLAENMESLAEIDPVVLPPEEAERMAEVEAVRRRDKKVSEDAEGPA